MTASLVDHVSVLIQHLQVKPRLTFVIVAGRILKDDGILHDEDTLADGIDGNIIRDRFGFTHVIPVTQTHRSQRTVRHGLQETIRSGVILRRIDMEGMPTLDGIRTKVHYADIVIRRLTCRCRRVHTIGTEHVRSVQVHIVHAVVLRTINEDLRLIDIVGMQGLARLLIVIRTADTHIVRAFQDVLQRIGAFRSVFTAETFRTLRDTTDTVRPSGLTGLTVLDIKLIGGTRGLPGDDQGGVFAMRINDHVLRLLDGGRVDLEVINGDTGVRYRVLGVAVHPDKEERKVLGRVSGIDAHHIGKRYILPGLTAADELILIWSQGLASTHLSVGQTTAWSSQDRIKIIVTGCGQVLLTANHDVQFGRS